MPALTRLHERISRVVYRDFDSYFEELLRRDSSTTLNQRNLPKLMSEIFKVKIGIATELMKGIFDFTGVPYNLRIQFKCNRSMPCTEKYGIETASSIGPKLWNKVLTEIKIPNPLRNLKCELKVGFPKTVLASYVTMNLM